MVHIAAVGGGGHHLTLTEPLAYEHLGETRQLPGDLSVDFRSNVALLSRNLVVQGDPNSDSDRHGAHIMLHSRGKASIADRSQGEPAC